MKKANRLFDLIAPAYGLFFDYQVRHFAKTINRVKDQFDIGSYNSVIDIGCGTGALCSVLNKKGLKVTGVDASKKMLEIAERKEINKNVRFIQASAMETLPFPDKSFDIAIASYVAHGLREEDRQKLYEEMSRLASRYLILHDYNRNRSLAIDAIEALEGGDYFNFIKLVKAELEKNFREVRIIEIDLRASWYICIPNV